MSDDRINLLGATLALTCGFAPGFGYYFAFERGIWWAGALLIVLGLAQLAVGFWLYVRSL